jgi:hypothetical protein
MFAKEMRRLHNEEMLGRSKNKDSLGVLVETCTRS